MKKHLPLDIKHFIGILFLFLGSFSYAATYYVNDNSTAGDIYTTAVGNNANAGTAVAPFATLKYVLENVVTSGDVVFVDVGTYSDENILKSSSCVDNITVIGAGSNLTNFVHVGGGTQEIFLYIECDNWTVRNLSAKGYRSDGGTNLPQAIHIRNAQNILLDGVLAFQNLGSGGDGAIGIGNNSTVTIQNTSASCNIPGASYSGGYYIYGNNTTVTMNNLVIVGNSRDLYYGGGIEIDGGGRTSTVVTINNCIIEDNSADSGGGLFAKSATVNINNTCFNNNTSNGDTWGGGAIAVNDDATVNINQCRFVNNRVTFSSSDGGAICMRGNNNFVNVTQCYFEGNSASDKGNALFADGDFGTATLTVTESYFADNTQGSFERTGGSLTIRNSDTRIIESGSDGISGNNNAQSLPMPADCVPLIGDCSTPCNGSTPNLCKVDDGVSTIIQSQDGTTLALFYDLGSNGSSSTNITDGSPAGIQSTSINNITNGSNYFQASLAGDICNTSLTFFLSDLNICCTAPTVSITQPTLCAPSSIDLSAYASSSDPITFHTDLTDANNGTNALGSTIINTAGTYYVRVDNGSCFDIKTITVDQGAVTSISFTPSTAGPYCDGDIIDVNADVSFTTSYTTPTTCDFTLRLHDLGGDGWDSGNSMTLQSSATGTGSWTSVTGVAGVSVSTGSQEDFTFTIDPTLYYRLFHVEQASGGGDNTENAWEILDNAGNNVLTYTIGNAAVAGNPQKATNVSGTIQFTCSAAPDPSSNYTTSSTGATTYTTNQTVSQSNQTLTTGSNVFTLTTTDSDGCAYTQTVDYTATVCASCIAPTVSHTSNNETCEAKDDGDIDLTIDNNGSATSFTYQWTGTGGYTNTTQDITDLPDGTYNYTVIGNDDDGTCRATGSITINAGSTPSNPTFTQLGPYCINASPPTLPTTSTNGISGTWDAIIDTSSDGSIVYTFTPNTTECASTTTMTIVVNCCANAGTWD